MTTAVTSSATRPLPAPVAITILAVMLAGVAASALVAPMLLVPTLAIVAVLARLGVAAPDDARLTSVLPAGVDLLPSRLRARVRDALRQAGSGDAAAALGAVVAQAQPIFASQGNTLDAAAERATRENVSALVEACCDTALEVARLDGAAPPPEMAARVQAARAVRVERLAQAKSALAELYLSGLEHGSPAAERVGALVAELGQDARARGAAKDELHTLLDG